jgi:histidinol-phosphatase (PHP family)
MTSVTYLLLVLDLHTHLWPHEPGTPLPTYDELARYCDHAAARGIERVAITEHSHRFEEIAAVALPRWERDGSPSLREATDRVWRVEGGARIDDYVAALESAQDRGVPILIGLEVDYLPGANEAIAALLQPYPFDVLLGSVHWLGAWLFDAYGDVDFGAEWQRRSLDAVWAQYADAIADLAQSGNVDVIAHLDVIKVAGHRPVDLAGFESRLCDALATSDVVVEVSSAGWRKPAGELYPSPTLLRRLHEAGTTFTTASDAHQVDQIGHRFVELYAELDALGVESIATFERRRRALVPVS